MVRFVLAVFVLSSVIIAGDEPEPSEAEPEFTFLRLVYSGTGWRGSSWAVDYPKADLQFLYALQRLSDFTFVGTTNKALPLSDPEIFRYPFIYAVEVDICFSPIRKRSSYESTWSGGAF